MNPNTVLEIIVSFSVANTAALRTLRVVEMNKIAANIKEGIISDPKAAKLRKFEMAISEIDSGLLLVDGKVFVPEFRDFDFKFYN